MKAIIRLDVPDWQIGKKVSVYFPDSMVLNSICEIDNTDDQFKMRDATEEERKSTKAYIDSISKPTGLQFDDIYEELNFVQPHKKLSVKLQLCEDCISREAVIRLVEQYPNIIGNRYSGLIADIKQIPSVTPQELILDKIRAEIKSKIVKRPWLDFEDREKDRNDAFLEVLDIINKYKAESEDNNGIVIDKNLCDSCTTKGCIFQSGIVRNQCEFYKAESEDAE